MIEAFDPTQLQDICDLDKFYFVNVFELRNLCVCKNSQWQSLLKRLSFVHIGLGFVGAVFTLVSLFVTSALITKSSTAFLISIVNLYNLLRIGATFFLGVFTLFNARTSAQRSSNFMWLLGSWGVSYTMLDLVLEQLLAFRNFHQPARKALSPMRAVKKTLLVLLVGLSVNAMALVHAVFSRMNVDCNDELFYYAYSKVYSLYFVVIVHWVAPYCLLLLGTLALALLVIRSRRLSRSQATEVDFAFSASHLHDFHSQKIFTLCLTATHLLVDTFSLMNIALLGWHKSDDLGIADQKHMIMLYHVAEVSSLVSIVLTPLIFFTWGRFRAQTAKFLRPAPRDPLSITASKRSLQSTSYFSK